MDCHTDKSCIRIDEDGYAKLATFICALALHQRVNIGMRVDGKRSAAKQSMMGSLDSDKGG